MIWYTGTEIEEDADSVLGSIGLCLICVCCGVTSKVERCLK